MSEFEPKEIVINNEKAWRSILVRHAISGVLLLLILEALLVALSFQAETPLGYTMLCGLPVIGLWKAWAVWRDHRQIKTLRYDVEPHSLTRTYTIITKTREQARLQVINDVTIEQDWIDKLFGFFDFTVDYGFSDGGYAFTVSYLSEEQALWLQKHLSPSGRQVRIR